MGVGIQMFNIQSNESQKKEISFYNTIFWLVFIINLYIFLKMGYNFLSELYNYSIYLDYFSKNYKYLTWLRFFVRRKTIINQEKRRKHWEILRNSVKMNIIP